MDTGTRKRLDKLFPLEKESPWFENPEAKIPEWMQRRILSELNRAIGSEPVLQKLMPSILRTLVAACLLLLLLFSFEQFKTVHQIKLLEEQMALYQGTPSSPFSTNHKLLIINRFVSWSEIKSLRFQPENINLEEQLLPTYLQPNLFGDKKLKEQFGRYIREIQLATKIYLQ